MRLLSVFIFIFIFASVSLAQINGQLIEQSLNTDIPFTVNKYGTKHGLPQSQVLSIISKKNGNLIIGTANGIVEYNGLEFKPISQDNAYKKHHFTKLTWHEKTNRLFGERLDGRTFLILPKLEEIIHSVASCIIDNDIYCIDLNGIIYKANVYDLKFVKILQTHVKEVKCLFFEKKHLLVGGINGIYKINLQTKQITKLFNDKVFEFKKNPFNNCVYAICHNSILKITDDGIEYAIDFGDKSIICKSIDFVNVVKYYVATSEGLFEVNTMSNNKYKKVSFLTKQYLETLYYNKSENCLFVGTSEEGLLKLQLKNCHSFSSVQRTGETASLVSIIKTSSGDILASTIDGNIYKICSDKIQPYFQTKISCASLAEINDTIVFGTWGKGIKFIKNKQFTDSLIFPKSLSQNHVFSAFQDSKKNIWIGGHGISKGTSFKNVKPYLTDEITGSIITIYELKNKNICFGGENGFFILDNNGKLITHLGKKEGIKGREVRAFYEDYEGKLWIGTYDGGLYCYFKNKLKNINLLPNSKLDNDAFCLAKDTLGYLYMTSNHGLWRVKEADLSDFYYGKLNYLIPFYYGEETGIRNTEFNGGFQNNYLKTQNNLFYFPSLQGHVIVYPEQPVFKKLKPIFDKILINDTIYPIIKKASLERNTYSIQFDFSCVAFINKYNIYYQYKLEQSSQKQEWSPLQKKGTISFKLLPPGDYTFTVRALDAFNDTLPSEITYQFKIKPYFYETNKFKILLVCLIIALVAIFVRRRIFFNKLKSEEKERVKRELAELELKAIQAQMNPHFIFNSLNSIKHYLFMNDTKSADIFIDHFSILLRDFLEYSNKDFITLEKEVEMLTSYLSLEKMRMNPPFEYTINLPKELNKIKIPTLLFQPFVENAVKHGITHASNICFLNISFVQINDFVVCTIDDNGIGRKKSSEINQRRNYHTSKGISIVNDKIKIIKQIYDTQIDLKIKDKLTDLGNSSGTFVIIKIPINLNYD